LGMCYREENKNKLVNSVGVKRLVFIN